MTDILVLAAGLVVFILLKLTTKEVPPRTIVGYNVIVKFRNPHRGHSGCTTHPNHIGTCNKISGNLALCNKADGATFYANVSKLFWSQDQQAFVEKV